MKQPEETLNPNQENINSPEELNVIPPKMEEEELLTDIAPVNQTHTKEETLSNPSSLPTLETMNNTEKKADYDIL